VYPASIKGAKAMRNASLTTIAPTGTLSLLANCSSGIEPIFDRSYTKTVMDDVVLDLSRKYTYPESIRTAHEVSPENHVRMQAAFQKHCDSAVSKTINLPHDATVEDVKKALMLGYELGCKGMTFYRDGTREAPLRKKDANKEKDRGLSECENGKCDIF
jgi:ribonucleoside-diphosphate reductase alpha chain